MPVSNIFACTGLLLKTLDQNYIYARTLEFGADLKAQILFTPRAYQFVGKTSQVKIRGLTWQAKYAVLGANAFGTTNYLDGVNEQGLAGGLFYFPDFAKYQEIVQKQDYQKSLPIWQLLTWILTSFKNVSEVKKEIAKIYVTDVVFPEFKSTVPAHLIVHDLAGQSLVIEYVNGKLNLHDNILGVFTNSPDFSWHLTNLRNYLNLSPVNINFKKLLNVEFAPVSQGSGMHGLPGDFSSPSRFVRVANFLANLPEIKNSLDGVYQAFHVLNNFDIPAGSVVDQHGHSELTNWTSAIDLKNQVFYFKNYQNFQVQKFDLKKFDFKSQKAQQFSMSHPDQIIARN